jgi:hypothetical protein
MFVSTPRRKSTLLSRSTINARQKSGKSGNFEFISRFSLFDLQEQWWLHSAWKRQRETHMRYTHKVTREKNMRCSAQMSENKKYVRNNIYRGEWNLCVECLNKANKATAHVQTARLHGPRASLAGRTILIFEFIRFCPYGLANGH